jgi:hypothetical protein
MPQSPRRSPGYIIGPHRLHGGLMAAPDLKFYRHPTSGMQYAAIDKKRVRVKRGDGLWGEFDRDGIYCDGPLRSCDPAFCRWVTSELIYNEKVMAADNGIWPMTRLVTEKRDFVKNEKA